MKDYTQKQVAELTEKSKEDSYIIKDKLAEKEQEIEELKAANRLQLMDIEQIKAQLTSTDNQVKTLLQILSKINKDEMRSSTNTKNFIMFKLGALTNGEVGFHPDNRPVEVEPLERGLLLL